MHIESWQMLPNHPKGYTINEAEYIYQRKDPSTVPLRTIHSICAKSKEFHDSEIHEYFSEISRIREQWQADKRRDVWHTYSQQHEQNRKAYGDNYIPLQLQIITGEIAYEDVYGWELSAICKMAKRKQDYPVVDLMENLLRDKRADYSI